MLKKLLDKSVYFTVYFITVFGIVYVTTGIMAWVK